MAPRYIVRFAGGANAVEARLLPALDANQHRAIARGFGSCPGDALIMALGLSSGMFASSSDELRLCVAALRGDPVELTLKGRSIHVS
jgi:hypothetical protein